MQPMANDVRMLYRYSLDISPRADSKGSVPATYVRSAKPYRVYLYPTKDTFSKDPQGITYKASSIAIVNDTEDFKMGDRIGTEDRQMFEVVNIHTFSVPVHQQQMEVKEL